MEFLSQLEEDTYSKQKMYVPFDEDFTYRGFNHIKIGDLSLSIQASFGHYCTPRKTLKSASDYTSMEFALIKANGDFTTVSEILPNFSRLSEIEEYENTVYGFVPVELIEELYQELKTR